MGRYREKTCPTCGTVHRKQGQYCSRSCGNARQHTKEHKQHLSKKQSEHMTSAAAAEQVAWHTERIMLHTKKRVHKDDADLQEMTYEDIYVPPVTPKPIRDDQFVQDGDLWTEV